jgi:hypothetical protein
MGARWGEWLDRWLRPWRLWLLILWLATCAWLLWDKWGAIRNFALSDTDDNMRMMQVRALLEGQGWFDLRQYRLSPPGGADIHWSRLVDLPIAGIKLALAPFLGGRVAEQYAVAIAPMLPMLVAMGALAVAARRLIEKNAFIIAIGLLAFTGSARAMWSPLRIDHHGWQLAMLALVVVALVDAKRARGGVLLGMATALSLTIGLELLPYLALAGGVTVVRWIVDPDQARRLAAYGVSLAGGCCLGFLLFASEANRAPVCDALSPVWLSAMVVAGAISLILSALPAGKWPIRLAAAGVGGALLAVAFALVWPDCLGRPEGFSEELERLWLSKVREAMPVYRHGARSAASIVTLPIAGLIGYALILWREKQRPERLIPWASVALLATTAAVLLLWQTRAAAAAQLLSVPGATALVWLVLDWFFRNRRIYLGLAVGLVVFVLVSGLGTRWYNHYFPAPTPQHRRPVNVANNFCPTMTALRAVAAQPKGLVLTFVDLGPRLIAVTHHDAIIGPYHRNAQQIVDVMRAWRGDEANALATVRRYGVDYVLICPNLSESTIYRAEAPKGFYVQLVRGRVPEWLEPVEMPKGSPYRMWRVRAPS